MPLVPGQPDLPAAATVPLWDPVESRQRATLTGQRGAVNALAVSPDGSWLASAGEDGTVRLWSAADGALLTALRSDDRLAVCCWLPRQAPSLALGGSKSIYLVEYRA